MDFDLSPFSHSEVELLTDLKAQHFLELYARETGEVAAETSLATPFVPTTAQLTFAARVAWRNAARCIGRGYWPALHVRDLRHISEPEAVFAELRRHLALAWNGGKVQSVISVFGPDVRILNDQLIRYAGYPDGRGDPQNRRLTAQLVELGWQAPEQHTDFDVLPLAIQTPAGTRLFEWEAEDIQEVPLLHPEAGDLGLRWHALPVISNMELRFAGLTYPCAPFNGWYLATEIGARNLADQNRYDRLPELARRLGLDTSRERTLWRDRALVELNRAVLYSFDRAGVRIDDHHSLSQQFVAFEERERAAGRRVNGQWDWLIPPLSPATTPVWARIYREDRDLTPGFFHPRQRPASGCPVAHGA
ncbi:nitric oxide synthase oxygenase [Deinococcus piscis]|uniref:Nitric oxide synthase oxygenase n=1 Tax=Deinococcus piscis TaxID=394230 RepID=A0ABQ3KAJ7_9DEIO|nr:nitric oxide synthase oxygenase [Deinococcus piscis]GHG10179.1 nitric oxide synthase oxygenase [Deinococcus piscis]